MHLSNLDEDMGERRNLVAEHPELVAELRAAAERWRAGIELRWAEQWLPKMNGTTSTPSP